MRSRGAAFCGGSLSLYRTPHNEITAPAHVSRGGVLSFTNNKMLREIFPGVIGILPDLTLQRIQ